MFTVVTEKFCIEKRIAGRSCSGVSTSSPLLQRQHAVGLSSVSSRGVADPGREQSPPAKLSNE
jgi:hypothetical protein